MEAAETENRDLRKRFYVLKEELEELQQKMSFFDAHSAVDAAEIEEALLLVRKRKEAGEASQPTLDFLQKVGDVVVR